MSFSIRLGSDIVAAEAGATTPVTVFIENRNASAEQFEVEIEGVDPEWKAVPVPVVSCGANETCSERFFFRPPRASESLAGNYPFVVRVRSLESGEARSVQGVLEVRPFHHLSMEINPKRGVVSSTRRQNVFDITLVNLGNTEHTIRLQGNDPEDALAFEFNQEQITIGPGQQRQIEATANPTSSRLISSGRLIGFTVTGRSVDVPAVVTSAQAQLEQRSLFSPASLVLILLFALIVGAWFISRPKPPNVLSFDAAPAEVEMGQPVTLSWSVGDASIIRITTDAEQVTEETERIGEYQFVTPVEEGRERIVFELIAERNGVRSEPVRATVRLRPKEVIADPKINSLTVNRERVKFGESFILSYKFSPSVTRAVLSPDNVQLDPALPSISMTPKTAGRLTYTVTAYNKANKTVARTFTVNVVEVSDAAILSFLASPNPVKAEDGRVSLSWSVLKTAPVQIKANGSLLNIDETATSGSVEVPVERRTTFTLTAYDENGRPTTQNVVVNVVEPPKPVEPEEDLPDIPFPDTVPPITDERTDR